MDNHKDMTRYVAIDFDDTIMDARTERPVRGAKDAIRAMKDGGCFITVFTNRLDQRWTWVRDWMDRNGIPFDRIQCGKPFYEVFIDDKAAKFEGWDKQYL